jgi:pyruvate,water dikinase
MALEFPPVSVGKPVPLGADAGAAAGAPGEVLCGTPVSRGVVVGRARVARTIAEAEGIEPGEILVVAYTDVGWAPYFVHAAGLLTEIGGTLSHGAVVAREYGLPAVVNLPGITRRFRTGDLLRLDGTTGEVRRLDGAPP